LNDFLRLSSGININISAAASRIISEMLQISVCNLKSGPASARILIAWLFSQLYLPSPTLSQWWMALGLHRHPERSERVVTVIGTKQLHHDAPKNAAPSPPQATPHNVSYTPHWK